MSRLLCEALTRARSQGRVVLSVGGIGGRAADAGDAFDTLDECLARMRRMRRAEGSGPPVLGIDDAHLLDTAAAAQLHTLASAHRVCVIATVMREVSPPVGIDRMWLEHHVERVDLTRFDRMTAARALRARLSGSVGTATLEQLWSVTSGHPLLLRELVEQSLADGSLHRVDGVWRWRGLPATPAERLANVVLLRLRDLSPEEHELVRMLAVAEPLETDLIVQSGLGSAAESLYIREVVKEERCGRRVHLRLTEPLSGYVLLSQISELTGRRLRKQVADALTATGARREDDLLRIVTLRIDAGLALEQAQLLGAVRSAVQRENHQIAERLCHVALAREGAGSADGAAARLLLARALFGMGRHEEAERQFTAAAEVPGSVRNTTEYLAALRDRIDNLAWGLRRVEEAAALTHSTVEDLDGAAARALEGSRAALALLADRFADAVAVADRVLPLEPAGSPAVQTLLPVAAFARLELGDPVGALELLRAHQGRLEDWEEDARRCQTTVLVECLYHLGDQDAAASALEDMDRGTGTHDRSQQLRTSLLRARLSRQGGRLTEAVALLREAGAVRGRRHWLDTRARAVGWLAGALAESGEHSEALYTLIEAGHEEYVSRDYVIVEDGIAHERALVLAYSGDVSGSVAQALEVARRAAASGRSLAAVAALHLAARVADAAPLAHQARRLADGTTSALARLQADHIAALAASDGDALSDVAARFRAMGALPLAAEALAQSGRANQSAGQLRKSQAAWAECQEVLTATKGSLPPWAAWETPDESPAATLTTREREVAVLVASGLSNREVAARLVLSVRTVENHLHRTYNKLGISARTDIGRALTDRRGGRTAA
ncbi:MULTISPECIES: helix-turn-helix transcriptional regulator [unclassified Streptomyces]|uniref:helix-turn-helix transcriptional regulator n=1 Tax=unclassified Streptomyces TaxID=2593676 RepID=UPI0033BBF9A3